ncbi:molybdenum cofactor guanylyltransferase [Carboxylicivirga marina]|uniref:Probable molybdenum cofactor guanylyltransferase n=1 Tax=Carboxylicivirga marina TaxID=2800988 RepID=A0ABS1HNW7_9BACT|nr:molybdenum cofactor guanylyltransferase [Carboxylicivirga marina]MBK3519281.1 molybdenum cofactor guanylyltransferase [Carboxylicivirga marina]
MEKLTGIVLAGGLSSRMGKDKGLIQYNGSALIEYSINALKPLCSEIIISSNNTDYSKFGYGVVADEYKMTGPIGGLYSALSASDTDDVIMCPCDMPFVTNEIFEQVLNKKGDSSVAVIESMTHKVYPTLGYFHKSCLPIIKQQIVKGQYKLQLLLKELKAQTILIDDTKALLNFNSPEDLL